MAIRCASSEKETGKFRQEKGEVWAEGGSAVRLPDHPCEFVKLLGTDRRCTAGFERKTHSSRR